MLDVALQLAESTSDLSALTGVILAAGERLAHGSCSLALVTEDGKLVEFVRRAPEDGRPTRARLEEDSTVGKAIREGRLVTVDDAASEAFRRTQPPAVAATLGAADVRVLACAPMRAHGRVLGSLNLARSGEGATPFSERELATLQTLALHAGLAIANARLADERAARLARITQAARRFAEHEVAIPDLLDIVVREAGDLVGDYGMVSWVDEDAGVIRTHAWAADPALHAALGQLETTVIGESALARTIRQNKPVVVTDTSDEHQRATKMNAASLEFCARYDVRAFMTVPMRVRGVPIGSLAGGRTGRNPRPFDERDIELLQNLAHHAGLAIGNARLLERVRGAEARLRTALTANNVFVEATAEPATLLPTIVEHIGRELGVYVCFAELTEDRAWFEYRADFAEDAGYLEARRRIIGPRFPSGPETAGGRAFHEGHPVVVRDLLAPGVQTLPDPVVEIIKRYDVRDLVVVPVRSRGESLGVLFVQRYGPRDPARELGEIDVALIQLLADQVGIAIGTAELVDTVRRELAEHQRTRAVLEQTQANLVQAQRMESIGRLAGGVAHEFNNTLSVVLSYVDLVNGQLREGDPLRDDMEQIRRAGQRAADFTRQLLAFGRKQMLSPRVVDLNGVVTGVRRMLERIIGEDIQLRAVLNEPLDPCTVDPGQMEQVLMNLVVNARDAMPGGGVLTIETANIVLDTAYVDAHADASVGPHVMLAVTDTGTGMDKATLAQIFDPFFTTKPQGVGTGLGLATVYGIVRQSGGCIWVYSEPGKGSTFKIYLPRATGDAVAPAAAPTERRPPLRGTETVLVTEDEPQVRILVQGILARSGYDVLVAASGDEALAVAERHPGRIHLLLTDVVMPRMSGRQLAEKLQGARPDLKVLYMSGYTENAIVHHGVLDADVSFLPKPITPQALLEKVRAVLGRRT